ncbi:MAG: hypothetical protein COA42_17595 [Alteromonadaceae bacterium]|nr:MAG: hypothetical protein COA42_17595 [Alteromonadaceae bacterium]
MYVFCVDDVDGHREKIQEVIESACAKKGITDCTIIGCCDGVDFLKKVEGKTPQFVTMDLNMPNMDGLSALVRYKRLKPSVPVIIASSENESVVGRLNKPGKTFTIVDPEKQKELLAKVIDRVSKGIVEPKKMNSVLEAVANLRMDPIAVARSCGAKGILVKPYDRDKTAEILARFL